MFYRIATQVDSSPTWRWKSMVLSELSTVFRFLRPYGALQMESLRVFSSSERVGLEEQLVQENKGLRSNGVMAAQFLRERLIRPPEVVWSTSDREAGTNLEMMPLALTTQHPFNERNRGGNILARRGMGSLERGREDLESGTGGDHDLPYRFTLPISTLQVLAWMKLLARVQNGELHP
jgi:hypothetical protein